MVKVEYMEIMKADMGSPNPLPDIKNVQYIHAGFEVTKNVSEEERKYLGKGMIDTVLPYKVQDGYSREKTLEKIKSVVLENDYLKAVFLPEYGARLWQLYDKKNGRDILYTNTVIQPCNFAILNAWLSGGVEFNVGIKGHTPLTCSSMFCEKIDDETVKFYEFERIRRVSYCITAYLPKNSETLYLRTRIENTEDKEKYMYWWSNIAFPETEKTRVIVPASEAIHCSYQENHYVVDKTTVPISKGIDVSYSMNLEASADYFYQIPDEKRKWIVAVDPNGVGLLQYSSARLKSRKLFLWGNKTGGRHWNEFLSEEGQAYIEIQAGLASTQLEHIPMPAETVWEWTEGYTSVCGTNANYYGDWNKAIAEVERVMEEKIASGMVAPEKLQELAIGTKGEILHTASGWGALENMLRAENKQEQISNINAFPVVKDDCSAEFLQLLEKGYLPCPAVEKEPSAYVVGKEWLSRLEQSTATQAGAHWYSYLQIGVTEYALGNFEKAETAWKKSVELCENVWALRNLSALYKNEFKDVKTALAYQEKVYARKEAFDCLSLVKEYASWLTSMGMDEKWIQTYSSLDKTMQENGRLLVYLAMAFLHVGEAEKASEIITPDFILCDVKEGELALSKLWKDIYMQIVAKRTGLRGKELEQEVERLYPLPYSLDFRMHD